MLPRRAGPSAHLRLALPPVDAAARHRGPISARRGAGVRARVGRARKGRGEAGAVVAARVVLGGQRAPVGVQVLHRLSRRASPRQQRLHAGRAGGGHAGVRDGRVCDQRGPGDESRADALLARSHRSGHRGLLAGARARSLHWGRPGAAGRVGVRHEGVGTTQLQTWPQAAQAGLVAGGDATGAGGAAEAGRAEARPQPVGSARPQTARPTAQPHAAPAPLVCGGRPRRSRGGNRSLRQGDHAEQPIG
mmetsp:Transcript_35404/g.112771  ORF Transcript_35404/g.112771 Transcript_35404/m.112771 type:complete len:248 (-) Transcript_35404:218-961(-)